MATAVVTANSTEAQLAQLTRSFAAVRKKATSFETHQSRSTELLHEALSEVYAFGTALFAISSPPGGNIVRDFIVSASESYNARVRANPYLALAKMAFPGRSASSISQYSTVLRFAGVQKIKPGNFYKWLSSEGIKDRLDEATEALGSAQRANNDRAKRNRLKRATAKVEAMPTSSAVALPSGIEAPEGFAIVLARIDGSNNASIVDVLDSAAERVDPMLLRYDGDKGAPNELIAKPLGRFWRAIDLLLSCTPAKIGADILVTNAVDHGREVCSLQIAAKALNFPGAAVLMAGHVGGLQVDETFVLTGHDAELIQREFSRHDGWAIDDRGNVDAANLGQTIRLTALPNDNSYRVALAGDRGDKAIEVSLDEETSALIWLEERRRENTRQNASRAAKREFPGSLDIEVHHDALRLRVPGMLAEVGLGSTMPDRDLDGLNLAIADIEAVLQAANRYQTALDGWWIDGDIEDAGLALEAHLDDDRFQLVIPTRTGGDYNDVCGPLSR